MENGIKNGKEHRLEEVESPGTSPLEVHDLTVSYNRRPVLWDIDFTVPEGKLIAVVGPNGAGKSTLIKAAMGLIPSASGYVRFFGQGLAEARQRVAYVPQRTSVDWDFPTDALDVVLMGRYGRLRLFQRPRRADVEAAHEALNKVGMQQFANRQISQLSGGQQQRVFLARALAQDADLYLMDEPFAGVDAATEAAIVELLRQMRALGKTVIVVHHDLQTVQDYFDWALLLNMRLIAFGPMEQSFTNQLLQKTYGGRLNLLTEVADLIRHEQRKERDPL
ncbi:MAG: ABC transporter ATP-binding protein [Chlorobi bacterium CHB2]|nr:ABC transporter ATP-binding protein [Chlorobi bacterium CHB2]